jgi:hypothetical protein
MSDLEFSASSFAKVWLLQKPLYREDGALWDTVMSCQDELRRFFREIGQDLVCDAAEGFAFLRQIQTEDDTRRIPRLVRRSALSYDATLLLVCLREEFLRFDTGAEESRRLVRRREDLRELVGAFLRETNNQVKDVKSLDRAIDRLAELGFLGKMDTDDFEVRRIVKARIGPAELETIRERLRSHADARA